MLVNKSKQPFLSFSLCFLQSSYLYAEINISKLKEHSKLSKTFFQNSKIETDLIKLDQVCR